MKTIIITLIGLLALGTFDGCEKKTDANIFSDIDGVVLFYGDPSVDGCGWIIKTNDLEYSPISIDAAFQKANLNVNLSFEVLTTTWNCGWRVPGYKQIKIINIKKR